MAFLSRGVDSGGLAGAVGAEQSEHLAQADLRTHVTEDGAHRQRVAFSCGLLFTVRSSVCWV
jgi:hypothetical protein